jgi:hypothetical protein
VGASFLQELTAAEVRTPVRIHGIPQEFLDHAKRPKILEAIGLTPQAIALDTISVLDGGLKGDIGLRLEEDGAAAPGESDPQREARL